MQYVGYLIKIMVKNKNLHFKYNPKNEQEVQVQCFLYRDVNVNYCTLGIPPTLLVQLIKYFF